jgi:hypothetical protein
VCAFSSPKDGAMSVVGSFTNQQATFGEEKAHTCDNAFYEKVIKVKADVAAFLINCFPSA